MYYLYHCTGRTVGVKVDRVDILAMMFDLGFTSHRQSVGHLAMFQLY
jgi:hypothetical protein